jgi:hypothetical protein
MSSLTQIIQPTSHKNQAALELGRLGGKKGARPGAEKLMLSRDQRLLKTLSRSME